MLKNNTQTVKEDNVSISFEELVIYAEIMAKKMKGEKSCAICCTSELSTAMALLGCFAAGVTAIPMSISYGDKHCKNILHHISPTTFITDSAGTLEIYQIEDSVYKNPRIRPALIMCNQDSDGSIKGAMISDLNIITNLSDMENLFDIDESDSILITRPLYHSSVLTIEFLFSLIKGARIVFESNKKPSFLFGKLISEEITTIGVTPTMFSVLLDSYSHYDDLKLKHIIFGDEYIGEETAKKFRETFNNANIYNVYGKPETSFCISVLPPEYFDKYHDCVGAPLESISIKILNDKEKSVLDGEYGTLWVRGDSIMRGYYNDKEKTQTILKNGWFCTGDIAMVTSEGWLKIKGRKGESFERIQL